MGTTWKGPIIAINAITSKYQVSGNNSEDVCILPATHTSPYRKNGWLSARLTMMSLKMVQRIVTEPAHWWGHWSIKGPVDCCVHINVKIIGFNLSIGKSCYLLQCLTRKCYSTEGGFIQNLQNTALVTKTNSTDRTADRAFLLTQMECKWQGCYQIISLLWPQVSPSVFYCCKMSCNQHCHWTKTQLLCSSGCNCTGFLMGMFKSTLCGSFWNITVLLIQM